MGFKKYQLAPAKFLSEAEAEHLESVLKRHMKDVKFRRDALMIAILLRTGARAGEFLALKPEDFESEIETLFFRGSKGSNDRGIPIPEWIVKHLKRHLRNVPPGERIFNISYNRLLQVWNSYRPVKKTLHSLRHTFAIRLYRRTKDLRLVQNVLGHRRIENTMIYLDYVHSVNELRRILF